MGALDSDWGDPGFVGDYPALRSGTEPSAPGKRAKRTFNKHQHVLQQLVAETVVLKPRNGARGPSKPPTAAPRAQAGASEGAKDAEQLATGTGRSKSRKRDKTAGSSELQNGAAKVQAGAEISNSAGHAATALPAKAKRQRNKFKAHLSDAAPGTAATPGAGAAHRQLKAAEQSSRQLNLSGANGSDGPQKRRTEAQPEPAVGEQANVPYADAQRAISTGRVGAVPSSAAAGAAHQTQQLLTNSDSSGAEQRDRSGKVGKPKEGRKKRRTADEQSQVHAKRTSAAQEPRQQVSNQHGDQPDPSQPAAATPSAQLQQSVTVQANGRKRKEQRSASSGLVAPLEPPDQLPAAGASHSQRQVAAPHAEPSGDAASPFAGDAASRRSKGLGTVQRTDGSTPALDRMRERLQGGRFRWLNEQMYSQPGGDSYRIMQVTGAHSVTLVQM